MFVTVKLLKSKRIFYNIQEAQPITSSQLASALAAAATSSEQVSLLGQIKELMCLLLHGLLKQNRWVGFCYLLKDFMLNLVRTAKFFFLERKSR